MIIYSGYRKLRNKNWKDYRKKGKGLLNKSNIKK